MVRKRENIKWAAVVWTKMPCWCQRRMSRLVRDDRKATVTQITTWYNQGMQNTISEHTTRQTLKQMGYSRRRPHRVPLLSDKKRKRATMRTGSPKSDNRRLEKCCLVWWVLDFCCDIQMVRSEFGVENMKAWIPPAMSQRFRLVVYNGVGDICLAHFGLLSTNWASFKRHSLPE